MASPNWGGFPEKDGHREGACGVRSEMPLRDLVTETSTSKKTSHTHRTTERGRVGRERGREVFGGLGWSEFKASESGRGCTVLVRTALLMMRAAWPGRCLSVCLSLSVSSQAWSLERGTSRVCGTAARLMTDGLTD